ncbi:hypothetical protein LUZ60_014293 [Juncus effusus]|nr:hypothetical protein LUZ60_014293 [Juncus effusus]
MLIQGLGAIPAVIPAWNSLNLLSRPSFHFKPVKLSFRAQSTNGVKPSLNPQDKGEEEESEDDFDPSELPFANIKVERGTGGAAEAQGLFPELDGSGRDQHSYEKDPEFAEILNSCIQDPQKGRSRVDERIKKKKSKIIHTKTGSANPMKVTFNKFNFNNSYIWFEFYSSPLPQDISLIVDAIRCWHIVGRLGGFNSMNMQLSQGPTDKKVPQYDAIEGANVIHSTFCNIGDFEVQDNLARVWIDIGTHEPLALDVLLNALTTINSDNVGIKQVVFGGKQFESWKENFHVEEAGSSVHKI